jgi:hypothetical protein
MFTPQIFQRRPCSGLEERRNPSEVHIPFAVADIRFLDSIVTHIFDVVLSCDNSISHLMDDADLLRQPVKFCGRLKRDGVFLATIRDYDQVLWGTQASAGNAAPLPGLAGSDALMRFSRRAARLSRSTGTTHHLPDLGLDR